MSALLNEKEGVLRLTIAGRTLHAEIQSGKIVNFFESDAAEAPADLHILFSDRAALALHTGNVDIFALAKSGDVKAEGDRSLLPMLGYVLQEAGRYLREAADEGR